MNRAERRRSAVTAKPKTYVLTDDQIAKIKQDAVKEATQKAVLMFLSIPVVVLSDKFSFDKDQLDTFMHYALSWFEGVHDNDVGLMELVRVAEQECGIQIINRRTQYD